MTERPPSGEFDLIERLFAPLAAGFPGAFGLHDDAAVLSCEPGQELVVTKDLLVEGVHFLPDDAPETVARKLLRVNLSDIAAMGAVARAYTLGLALRRDLSTAWLERFARGLAEDQADFAVSLIGGDTVATDGPLVLSLTAFGSVPAGAALRRSGAVAGDGVFVTGTIGDAALGLLALRGELTARTNAGQEYLIERYRVPLPRLGLGPRLIGIAHAAIDVSDGLIADLGHICETSGVGARIEAASIPLAPAAQEALAEDERLIETVLTGGDDYELLFCAPESALAALAALAAELSLPISQIGVTDPGSGVTVVDRKGQEIALTRGGYEHF